MSSSAAMAMEPVKVLWMDDEPDYINDYQDMLDAEQGRNYIKIDIATSIKEAREKLESDEYVALIVDCKMDRYSDDENGAKFLRYINEEKKDFPTFVYSGYLHQNRYQRYLKESHPIKVVGKSEISFERPISSHWFFKTIREVGERYLEVKDYRPEWITLNDYIAAPEKYTAQLEKHWKKHGHWINAKMKADNYRWVVVCGDNIVGGSNDLFDYPDDDELMEYGRKHNLVPFPYSKPSLPEDIHVSPNEGCGWSQTTQENDYYPAFVAAIDDVELTDDFDTGAQQTFVSDDLIKLGLFDRWRGFGTPHLGQDFEHVTKKITLTVIDSAGMRRSKKITVVVVKDWNKSPFIHFNENRKILFGRDILRAFELEVRLDSQKRITLIHFL
jgi:CheY-like chemotaxis protein